MIIHQSEIHIWTALPQEPLHYSEVHSKLLSRDEQARARRYHRKADTTQFVRDRVFLRLLLECYTGIPAKEVSFHYGPKGKPIIASQELCPDVRFNVSHSCGSSLFAFALGREVGVDVESGTLRTGLQEDISHFLGAKELPILHSTAADRRDLLCITYWVRKEACVKSLGMGLSCGPETVDVSKPPLVSVHFSLLPERQAEEKVLWITDLELDDGYLGACALEGPDGPKSIRYFHCDGEPRLFADPSVSG